MTSQTTASAGAGAPPGPAPAARLLGNGTTLALINESGTGFSSREGLALTAWRGDRVEDAEGFFVYLRDVESGAFWSAGRRPVPRRPEAYRVESAPGRFLLHRCDQGIESRLDVAVAPGEELELRRLTLVNRSERPRRIEVTGYAEVVLQEPAAYAAHPGFSKLFLETERAGGLPAALVHRRPRAAGERYPWLAHALVGGESFQLETDRARFIGRGRGLAAPAALLDDAPLSGTTGGVLDPALCLRAVLVLEPGAEATAAFLLGTAPDRVAALDLLERYANLEAVERAFAAAAVAERDRERRLGLSPGETLRLEALAGAMLYGHPACRSAAGDGTSLPGRTEPDAAGLVPGRPLAVLREGGSPALRDGLLAARRYWRELGLAVDLRILLETGGGAPGGDEDGVTYMRGDGALTPALLGAGNLVVGAALPDIAPPPEDAERQGGGLNPVLGEEPEASGVRPDRTGAIPPAGQPLAHDNGIGGFTPEGDYRMRIPVDASGVPSLPPRPWINVIANENFGFLASETGAGATWNGNSRNHRITPWFNDALLDPQGEAIYIRDDETGVAWSPLPGPRPAPSSTYTVTHAPGESRFAVLHDGLSVRSVLFAAAQDPVRIEKVRITNRTGRPRRISLFSYRRLALGREPEESARHIVTGHDAGAAMLTARSRDRGDFAEAVAFATAEVEGATVLGRHVTGDRCAFLGRGGSPAEPAALAAASLDGRTGADLDACMALQVVLELPPEGTMVAVFTLGEGRTDAEARSLAAVHRMPHDADRALEEARDFWSTSLARVRIKTPSPELDLLVNRWLPVQTLACRMRGRTAFYQSGGAFGFRDQLQDASALVPWWPEITRRQIIQNAAHQFEEGDVLHWWHPPRSRGLRTRFADDLLWLPYLTAEYVDRTGDRSILAEQARFLTARPLADGEDEAYLLPEDSGSRADVYEHCARALDRSLTRGEHGLPLFGTGDWNDGMNRVGRRGRGESVWMGFFLAAVIDAFLPLCEERGDRERAARYRAYRLDLVEALERAGWDGEWYLRAYTDDGEPLGTAAGDECRIDGLVQAWSVISGVAPRDRAEQAMDAVERHLVSEEDGIIRLLTPPFDRTPLDPGYIKGYLPGIRENGGQYTHAALWVVKAMAELGRHERAFALLNLLNPVRHARDPVSVARYQVEPYVVCADVYGAPPHVGRGGWTWYTGSAGWMLRVALESVLGLDVEDGRTLVVRPCIPADWPGYLLTWRVPGHETEYRIEVERAGSGGAVLRAEVDGEPAPVVDGSARVPLASDGGRHRVRVVIG